MRKRAQLLSSMDSPPPEKRVRPHVDSADDDEGFCAGIRRRVSTSAASFRRWWRSKTQDNVTFVHPENNENNRYVRKGFALLINHFEFNDPRIPTRHGTLEDAKQLKNTIVKLGFTVKILKNGSRQEVMLEIDKAVTTVEEGDFDCVMVVVMTHGQAGGILLAKDLQYNVQDVWRPFVESNKLNKELPKIFIFQACRGREKDRGHNLGDKALTSNGSTSHLQVCGPCGISVEIDAPDDVEGHDVVEDESPAGKENGHDVIGASVETDHKEVKTSEIVSVKHPNHYNVLIAYSTVEDYVSWRDPNKGTHKGSYYVQTLCSELKNPSRPALQQGLVGLLECVHRMVGRRTAELDPKKTEEKFKQAPSLTSSLTYKLFLYEHSNN